jgi:hypothetical protein
VFGQDAINHTWSVIGCSRGCSSTLPVAVTDHVTGLFIFAGYSLEPLGHFNRGQSCEQSRTRTRTGTRSYAQMHAQEHRATHRYTHRNTELRTDTRTGTQSCAQILAHEHGATHRESTDPNKRAHKGIDAHTRELLETRTRSDGRTRERFEKGHGLGGMDTQGNN